MSLLDCNVGLGRLRDGHRGFETADQLLAEMARLGIDEALAYHVHAAEADVRYGNRLLSDAVRDHPKLHACWVMAPPALGDLPTPSEWAAEAVAARVRAVRLVPRHSLYTIASWCVGPLFDALEKAKLPVFLDFGAHHWSEQTIPWAAVKEVCERHPQLGVVIVGATVGETRDVVSLLRLFPNLHLECHAFNLPDGLGLLAEERLSSKLLFGTGMPWRAGECVVEQTLRSGLRPADIEGVSGENARRLLGLDALAAASTPKPAVRTAGLVLDAHAHVGAWERTCTVVRTPEQVVRSMHRCGVHKMVVSSFSALHGETRAGNQETFDAVRRFPDHLYGYVVVNPHFTKDTGAELEQCFAQTANFVGIKLHCGLHQAQLQDAGYEAALAFADEHELPVLVHGGGKDDWAGAAQRYPGARFIMAHACAWDGADPAGRELYRQARDIENLYVDVAGSAAHRGALAALADLVGVKKVLFGSDFPMFDLAFELGRITRSGLSPAEKVMICGGNALGIFKRIPHSE